MADMKTYIKQSLMGLSRQVIEKNYQQQTLGARLQQFKDTRRMTRNEAMLQRRHIDVDNISPFESVRKKKSASKIPTARPPVSDRLEKLKKWREEKEKRKLEEKKIAKPIFKVCHVTNSVGLPNYKTINKEIKGKLVKSLAKTNQPKPSSVPKSQQFKAPETIKPVYFNNVKRELGHKSETSSNKNMNTVKTGAIKKSEIAKGTKKNTKNTASRAPETSSQCSPPARRITRLMSARLRDSNKKSPSSNKIPLIVTSPHTPKLPTKLEEEFTYISPFVTVSRGKDSVRKEFKARMSTGGTIPGNSATSPSAGAAYFSNMLQDEVRRMEGMCEEWSSYKEGDDVPEEAREMIDVALGQSKLLMSKKFQQFKQLIERCRSDDGSTQPVTCMDLHGFWDMMFMQVEDIDKRFKNLSALKSNGWREVLPEKKIKPKKTNGKRVKPQASSKIRDMIKQAKANNPLQPRSPFVKINTPRRSCSPGLAVMRLSQSIKRNDGLTPNRSILKTEDTKDKKMVKTVLFDLGTVRNKLNFDTENKENTKDPESSKTPLRRSRRLSRCFD